MINPSLLGEPDAEQLNLLRSDIEAWNTWRWENPKVRPNLKGADLSGLDLRNANLADADMTQARLKNAKAHLVSLDRARLEGADLRDARLYGTLSHADLDEADLRGADLSRCFLQSARLHYTKLQNASLQGATMPFVDMYHADLCGADLTGANINFGDFRSATFDKAIMREVKAERADFRNASLVRADLRRADLRGSDLSMTNMPQIDLRDATLDGAKLVSVNMQGADLTAASIFGVAAWDLNMAGAIQKDLVIRQSADVQPITLDDIEVAQFIYLLLNNQRIRSIIDTITSKVVLILGRFTPERIVILQALREELRRRNYLPILFDFQVPNHRDVTETVSTLAHMARFVIADLTDAKSLPQELSRIVPILPSVPVQPILLATEFEWSMYADLARYPWVLPIATYAAGEELIAKISSSIIEPAERKAQELTKKVPPTVELNN